MKIAYIINGISNHMKNDLICVGEIAYFIKKDAIKACKKLQKDYDEDDPSNDLVFEIQEVKLV